MRAPACAPPNTPVTVDNQTASQITVYPDIGIQLNTHDANEGVSLAAGNRAVLNCVSSTVQSLATQILP